MEMMYENNTKENNSKIKTETIVIPIQIERETSFIREDGRVEVTIYCTKAIDSVKGARDWEIKSYYGSHWLTKTFYANASEEIQIIDKNGNTITKNITINNCTFNNMEKRSEKEITKEEQKAPTKITEEFYEKDEIIEMEKIDVNTLQAINVLLEKRITNLNLDFEPDILAHITHIPYINNSEETYQVNFKYASDEGRKFVYNMIETLLYAVGYTSASYRYGYRKDCMLPYLIDKNGNFTTDKTEIVGGSNIPEDILVSFISMLIERDKFVIVRNNKQKELDKAIRLFDAEWELIKNRKNKAYFENIPETNNNEIPNPLPNINNTTFKQERLLANNDSKYIDYNYNLNNHEELMAFFNNLFINPLFSEHAPAIMKFFITTRNYGLKNLDYNLEYIISTNEISDFTIEVIKNGLREDGLEDNIDNFTKVIVKNYHEQGYFFHSFPESYKNSIEKFGLSVNKRTCSKDETNKYIHIINKYNFGEYYTHMSNKLWLTQCLDRNTTIGYGIESPEWLRMFLMHGVPSGQYIGDILKEGDYNTIRTVAKVFLNKTHTEMKESSNYQIEDYYFLENFIMNQVEIRFANGNHKMGIACVPINTCVNGQLVFPFEFNRIEALKSPSFQDFLNLHLKGKVDYQGVLNVLSEYILSGQISLETSIPNDSFKIVNLQLKNNKIYEKGLNS